MNTLARKSLGDLKRVTTLCLAALRASIFDRWPVASGISTAQQPHSPFTCAEIEIGDNRRATIKLTEPGKGRVTRSQDPRQAGSLIISFGSLFACKSNCDYMTRGQLLKHSPASYLHRPRLETGFMQGIIEAVGNANRRDKL